MTNRYSLNVFDFEFLACEVRDPEAEPGVVVHPDEIIDAAFWKEPVRAGSWLPYRSLPCNITLGHDDAVHLGEDYMVVLRGGGAA